MIGHCKWAAIALLLLLPGMATAQQVTPGASLVQVITTTGVVTITPTNAVETNITSLKIPANSMGKNGSIKLDCLWGYVNSANTKSLVIRFTGTAGSVSGGFFAANVAVTTTDQAQTAHVIRNNNATNAQIMSPNAGQTPYAASTSALVALAIDTTADTFLNLNATLQLGSEGVSIEHCIATVLGTAP